MDPIRKIKEKFQHDPLGATYYLIAIITAGGSAVVWVVTKIDRPDIMGYVLGGVLLLIAIGLFLAPRLRRETHKP